MVKAITQAVILAGGYGSRLSEETSLRPKPMVEIGGKPILWHIMKIYAHYGINNFIICCGYKADFIKDYFINYYHKNNDLDISIKTNSVKILNSKAEDWNVKLIDTGKDTMTGGRLRRVKKYLDENFHLTYGDGVGDINIRQLEEFHFRHKKLATITAVLPSGRFGALKISKENFVVDFFEKPHGDNSWINGGFFVLNKRAVDLVNDDTVVFEQEPLNELVKQDQLMAKRHKGFWQPMDTLKDKNYLNELIEKKNAAWMVWSVDDN